MVGRGRRERRQVGTTLETCLTCHVVPKKSPASAPPEGEARPPSSDLYRLLQQSLRRRPSLTSSPELSRATAQASPPNEPEPSALLELAPPLDLTPIVPEPTLDVIPFPTAPFLDEAPSQGTEALPQGVEALLQSNNATQQSDEATPQNDEATLRGDEAILQGNDAPPQDADASLQGTDASSQGDDASPQGDDISLQGADISPQNDDAPQLSGEGPQSPSQLPAPPVAYALPPRRAHSLAWVASLSLHGSLVALAAWLLASSVPYARGGTLAAPAAAAPESPRVATLSTTVEVDTLFDDSKLRLPEVALEPHPSGNEPTPRPDTGRTGHGGERAAARPALNLSDRDDEIELSKDVQSRLDRSQVQRLRVAADRASRDDRRATIEPMELTFLASGDGSWHERRPLAEHDPSRGARAAALPSLEGASAGGPARPPEGPMPTAPPGNARLGNRQASTGTGLMHGEPGPRHHQSADVAFGRPMVTQGRPAVPANVNDKPRDNVESVQEVSSSDQSLLHASTAGGEPTLAGRGGEPGPESTGSGGPNGPGSRAAPLGQGQGPLIDLDSTDPRLSDYNRRLRAKIHPLWANAFPRWAALEGLQGLAIIQFTVLSDGSVAGARVLRPSGVPEFDENVRRAVLRAAPFAPLPPNLNARTLNVKLTFDASNPAVRLTRRRPRKSLL